MMKFLPPLGAATLLSFAAMLTAAKARAEDPPTLEWIRQFGTAGINSGSRGVSADSLGNIFVAGHFGSARGRYLRTYDFEGNLQWSHEERPTNGNAIAYDVWADGLGNAYWVGGVGPTFVTHDPFVYKFDSNGTVLWDREIPFTGNALFQAVSGDNLGNIYMVGHNPAATQGDDSYLFKYNVEGNEVWSRFFSIEGIGSVTDVSTDGIGNIFVAGYTNGNLGGPNPGDRTYDAFLRKFNDVGDHLWTRQFGGTNSEFANGVVTDGMGNVVVAGERWLASGSRPFDDYDGFVRKYDSEGNLLWNRQVGSAVTNTTIHSTASDGYGNTYVSGSTEGSLGGANAGETDAFVRKHDSAGNVLWTYQLGSSSRDDRNSIWVDGLGSILIAGQTSGDLAAPKTGTTSDSWVALLREQNISIPEPASAVMLILGAVLAGPLLRRTAFHRKIGSPSDGRKRR